MYGACRAVGVGPPIEINGRSLPVHARTISDYAVLEGRMLELRGNPFDSLRWLLVCADGSREGASRAFKKLGDGWWAVTYVELLDWLRTWDGRIHALWLATRRTELGEIREWVIRNAERELRKGRWAAESWWENIQFLIDLVNGDDEVSALEWMAQETEEESDGLNWDALFRNLGDEPFHFPPDQVASMTLTQIKFFYCKREMAGKTHLPVIQGDKDMMRWTNQRAQLAQRATENLATGRHWSARSP